MMRAKLPQTFRARLLAVITLTVAVTIVSVGVAVYTLTEQSFAAASEKRNAALTTQFSKEFLHQGVEIADRLEVVARTPATLDLMIEFTGLEPDQSRYLHEMEQQAAAQRLDYLEILRADGTVLSSAQWANFNRKEAWATSQADWSAAPRFLLRQELVDERPLAVVAVKAIKVRGVTFLIAGGRRLDATFLDSLGLEPGMRARLFLVDQQGFTPAAEPPITPLLERVRNNNTANVASAPNLSDIIEWTSYRADDERVQAIPLTGLKNELLGVLVIGNSMREQVELARSIRWTTIAVGCIGLLFGILMSSWLSRRVTKPVEELAAAAGRVAHGEWETRVAASSNDELGQLAEAFNQMTEHLIAQREQLVQTERVAAWRELARRLAHELKNPLFPLQITVENLLRARQSSPEMFDEIFRESTQTLLAEIANLKSITGRFSDFSKMPAPQKQPFNLNEMVRAVGKLFSAQFTREGAPKIESRVELAADLQEVSADPVLIRRAIENLVLNALDAMPQGGTLTFRTSQTETHVRFELADSGEGLTPEECERLFTPYYTSKQHGTGLGLAIVQSVISDHGGRVSVQSEKGKGTTFVVELPK